MLSKTVLDKLIPLPTEEAELRDLQADLAREGYPVTNLRSGGVFYTLARMVIRVKLDLLDLLRRVLSDFFIPSCDNVDWLAVRAADFQVFRKQAVKAQGVLTLTRESAASTVRIPKGCIFKTAPDSSGEERRFLSTGEVLFPAGATLCELPVEAELAGADYNVPAGKITRCLIHLESVTGITNTDGWLIREGADIEELESLRARLQNVWSQLSALPIRDKYRAVAEAVPGVLCASVDDRHPRGQGTVDIIVTSATGSASDALLADVRSAAQAVAGPYDDLLVKASETVTQDVAVTIVLPPAVSDAGLYILAEEAVRGLFAVSRERALNELYLSDLIVAIKAEIPTAKSVRVTAPAADLVLPTGRVILPGDVAVTIERG